ncbi:hypothetical protein [Actinomadura macrotermitis]|uniref:Uncharacterized protein n=1 Tax=Actinomadura macrotermitis TaxID=2585200 RepID=A0A7K0BWN3_9ACTN|nr:hypothetical protein [Actinomadura macrotermitis]MQY05585.1 hypothetical protein [Actinomadura macrotermitis]
MPLSPVAVLYTLPQFAARVGLSPRTLRAKPLPARDAVDADGLPLWTRNTIDAWCRGSGRKVPADAHWIFHPPEQRSGTPRPARLFHTVIEDDRNGNRALGTAVHAIGWRTGPGVLVYLTAVDEIDRIGELDHTHWPVLLTDAGLLPADLWRQAVVVTDPGVLLEQGAEAEPDLQAWTIALPSPADHGSRGGPAGQAAAERLAVLPRDWIAHLLAGGLRSSHVPVWGRGLRQRQAIDHQRMNTGYVTVRNTTSRWVWLISLLYAAEDADLRSTHPAAFYALALYAGEAMRAIRDWYPSLPDRVRSRVAAVPQLPEPAVMDGFMMAFSRPMSVTVARLRTELADLLRIERDLPAVCPFGDAVELACRLLATLLADLDEAAPNTSVVIDGTSMPAENRLISASRLRDHTMPCSSMVHPPPGQG